MKYKFSLPVNEKFMNFSELLNKNNNDEIKAIDELSSQYYFAWRRCCDIIHKSWRHDLSISVVADNTVVVDGPQEILIRLANEGMLDVEEI